MPAPIHRPPDASDSIPQQTKPSRAAAKFPHGPATFSSPRIGESAGLLAIRPPDPSLPESLCRVPYDDGPPDLCFMETSAIVQVPNEWTVELEIRPRLLALLRAEARHSGRPINEILVDVVANFLRANPVSLR